MFLYLSNEIRTTIRASFVRHSTKISPKLPIHYEAVLSSTLARSARERSPENMVIYPSEKFW